MSAFDAVVALALLLAESHIFLVGGRAQGLAQRLHVRLGGLEGVKRGQESLQHRLLGRDDLQAIEQHTRLFCLGVQRHQVTLPLLQPAFQGVALLARAARAETEVLRLHEP